MEPVFPFAIALPNPGARNLTRVLHEQLRAAILDRRLPPGTELPSTRRVAAACGIARNTVIAAYDLLVAEGYVTARSGARSVVAELGMRPARRRQRARPRLNDDRFNPLWRLPAWTTTRFQPKTWTSGFEIGIPEHREFPLHIWRRLLARSLRSGVPESFGYQNPDGLPLLRTAIARHVAVARGVACSAEDIVVTSGSKQAFDLLGRLLVTPGRTRVAVEDPGYPSLRATMATVGAQLAAVPVDDEGLCVEQLPDDVRIVCVTPSHQFPTGVAMPIRRRAALLEFARLQRAIVIEDDYDSDFRYSGRPLDALQTLDRDATVFYVGTFSKSLFPSLRVGYVVAPAWAREALAAIKHCVDTHGNSQIQETLGHFILEGHLARYVRRMRKLYGGRRRVLLDGLESDLRPWLEPIPSEAGLHLAARLVDPRSAAVLIAKARRCAPGVQPFDDFAVTRGRANGLVFGYGCIDEDGIRHRLQDLRRSCTARLPYRTAQPSAQPGSR